MQAEAEKQPRKREVLEYHVLRSHYQVIWCNDTSPQPILPSPDGMYGWRKENDQLITIITTYKEAPFAVVLGKYKSNNCSCHRSDICDHTKVFFCGR